MYYNVISLLVIEDDRRAIRFINNNMFF